MDETLKAAADVGYYPLWVIPVIFGIAIACAAALNAWIPFFRRLVADDHLPKAGHFTHLEGLRGLLALGVLVHHGAIHIGYRAIGEWMAPPSYVFQLIGYVSVLFFFALTGFLFWSQLLKSGGQLDLRSFFTKRIRRLYPAYFGGCVCAFLAIAIHTNFELRTSVTDLLVAAGRWLVFSPFQGYPDLNDQPLSQTANAGVFWSLQWEWAFYLAIPFLALALRRGPSRLHLALIALGVGAAFRIGASLAGEDTGTAWKVLAYLADRYQYGLAGFLPGIMAAEVWRLSQDNAPNSPRLTRPGLGVLVLGYVMIGCTATRPFWALFTLTVFTALLHARRLHGLLSTGPLRTLGAMSYSLYLLHGVLLFLHKDVVAALPSIAPMSPLAYWSQIGVLTIALVLAAATSFRLLEYPFMPKAQPQTRTGCDTSRSSQSRPTGDLAS